MKNILVTGSNGQLGNEMRVLSAEYKEYTCFFTDVAELDICDEQAVMTFVKENNIHVIVNCAAYTAVDKAEDDIELCTKLNKNAVSYLAKAAEANWGEFIQISTDYEGMIREGEELAALNPHIVVKVPCIADGIKAIKYFTEKGIRTNCTLVFSVGQALLAAKAGATYVSPFVGRLDDICEDGVGLVGDIVRMYRTYDYKTQVLAASIRNTKHIIECVEMGADVATCPLSAIKGLLNHPLTDSGLKKFLEDYKKVNG